MRVHYSATCQSWLRKPPGAPDPKNFHKVLDRLWFVCSLDLAANAGEETHNNRLLLLAREGQKTTLQHLRRFDSLPRHATIVAYLSERARSLADESLDMHDKHFVHPGYR